MNLSVTNGRHLHLLWHYFWMYDSTRLRLKGWIFMQDDESELATLKSAPSSHDYTAGWHFFIEMSRRRLSDHIDIPGAGESCAFPLVLTFCTDVNTKFAQRLKFKRKRSPPTCCPAFVSSAEWSNYQRQPPHNGLWSWLWDRTGRGLVVHTWLRGSKRSRARPRTEYCTQREHTYYQQILSCLFYFSLKSL